MSEKSISQINEQAIGINDDDLLLMSKHDAVNGIWSSVKVRASMFSRMGIDDVNNMNRYDNYNFNTISLLPKDTIIKISRTDSSVSLIDSTWTYTPPSGKTIDTDRIVKIDDQIVYESDEILSPDYDSYLYICGSGSKIYPAQNEHSDDSYGYTRYIVSMKNYSKENWNEISVVGNICFTSSFIPVKANSSIKIRINLIEYVKNNFTSEQIYNNNDFNIKIPYQMIFVYFYKMM